MSKCTIRCAQVFIDETETEKGAEEDKQTAGEDEQDDSIPELSRKLDIACTGPSTSLRRSRERSFDPKLESPNV